MISMRLRLWGADNFRGTSKHQQANNDIIFIEKDLWGVQTPNNDTVVVSMAIANNDIKWYLVDNESSADMIFYDYFFWMQFFFNLLKPVNISLVRFIGDSIKMEGEIELSVIIEQPSR